MLFNFFKNDHELLEVNAHEGIILTAPLNEDTIVPVQENCSLQIDEIAGM
jgi:hypothetical protein